MSKFTNIVLNRIADFQNGGAWPQTEYVESGILVVRVSDIEDGTVHSTDQKYLSENSFDKYEKHALAKGDLVISTVGSHPSQPGSVVGMSLPKKVDSLFTLP